MSKDDRIRLTLTATAQQVAVIDEFQQAERLASRAETLELLLEIALDTIADGGRRFWDKAPTPPQAGNAA